MYVKECFKCNKKLPLTAFYKHKQMADGHLNKCKECNKKDATNHRNNNLEKVRAYDRARGFRTSLLLRTAHQAVSGRQKKPCALCNSKVNLELHHPDYSKPKWAVSLCRSCHRNTHAIININQDGIKSLVRFYG